MVTFLKPASFYSNKTASKPTSLSDYLKPAVLSSTIGILSLSALPMIANAGDVSASPDSVKVKKGEKEIWIDVLANDKYINHKNVSLSIARKPANGKVNTTSNHKIRYIPNGNFVGQDTFRYHVQNGKGKRSTATVTVNIESKFVTNPTAKSDVVEVKKGVKQIWIDVLANDKYINHKNVSLSIARKPANGKVNTSSNHKIRYIPNGNFVGQDTFRYHVQNGKGKRSTATVTVNIEGKVVNPIAESDVAEVKKGEKEIWIDVLANDKRFDHKTLSLSIVSKPANGKVNTTSKNKIRYIPNPDFAGQDQFLYKVTDKSGQQAIATVTIDVFNSNSPPDKDDKPSGKNNYVTLTWDPIKYNVQGYTIYTGPTSGLVNKQLSNIAINSSKLNKAKPSVRYDIDKDLRLASGEMVCFAVKAYNEIGTSKLSNPVCEVIR